jgi:dolichol-phosphate mannosyltransferase
MTRELTVIVPTYNELKNIEPLVLSLDKALQGHAWEVIFVDDDSADGTARMVKDMGCKDDRVRCLHRKSKRGLSSACIDGIKESRTPYVAVMDADRQHDERLLPQMLKCLKDGRLDLVVGSRYVPGGSLGQLSGLRTLMSQSATKFVQLTTGIPLKDPLSGYFLLTREFFDKTAPGLNGKGFKILLDIYLSAPGPVTFKELPYEFNARKEGESKLGAAVIGDYFGLIFDKKGWFKRA